MGRILIILSRFWIAPAVSNFFGLKKIIYTIDKDKQVTIDLLRCRVIDHTSLQSLLDFKRPYEYGGGHVILTGYELHTSKEHNDTSTLVKKLI